MMNWLIGTFSTTLVSSKCAMTVKVNIFQRMQEYQTAGSYTDILALTYRTESPILQKSDGV